MKLEKRVYTYQLAGRDGVEIKVIAVDRKMADFKASIKARDYAPAQIFIRSRKIKDASDEARATF